MSETRAVNGVAYKLASPKGTLLGTITIPFEWSEQIQGSGQVRFYVSPGLPGFMFRPEEFMPVNIHHGVLVRSHAISDAVELWGIPLEKFESLRGCSFSPGAAYLRSIIE